MLNNPFRPGFGSWPPAFVGREGDELLFREGLANGPGGRYHRSLVTGPRGVGKTVLLAAFRDIAESEGYVTIAVDANDGMIRRICRDLRAMETSLAENSTWKAKEVRAAGSIGVAGGHVEFARQSDTSSIDDDPMVMLKPLLEQVEKTVVDRGGAGIVLTVDELHAARAPELERLGNDLQHLQSIVFAGAALPTIEAKSSAPLGQRSSAVWPDSISNPCRFPSRSLRFVRRLMTLALATTSSSSPKPSTVRRGIPTLCSCWATRCGIGSKSMTTSPNHCSPRPMRQRVTNRSLTSCNRHGVNSHHHQNESSA